VSDGTTAVENSTVTLFSVIGGNFGPVSGLTNSSGYFTATFTAPNVTKITDIRIIASAKKTGYADGSDYKYLRVLPPVKVEIDYQPTPVRSEEEAIITVHVAGGFDEPIVSAAVVVSASQGILSSTTGITDSEGNVDFTYTAPLTLTEINVTMSATASIAGYADGYVQEMITIEPKVLMIEVTAEPSIVVSEGTTTITAHVTSGGNSVFNALVAVLSNNGGSFDELQGTTDPNGNCRFIFTAPQTVSELNATITVSATKSGYVEGQGQIIVVVEPKILQVQVTALSTVTSSEAKVNLSVLVTYEGIPLEEVNVTVTSLDGGDLSPTTRLTNEFGRANFTFTAPSADTPTQVAIKAKASKDGFADGESTLVLTVNPATFDVQVSVPSPIESTHVEVVTVLVTSNETGLAVANASVSMSTNYGTFFSNFTTSIGLTNTTGYATFIFNAPSTDTQLPVVLTTNVTKTGFISWENQTDITVTPETTSPQEGGWPITTILLIIIPIVIVVIVVILIKTKVIRVSSDEEEE
jgi:hypothetical protein